MNRTNQTLSRSRGACAHGRSKRTRLGSAFWLAVHLAALVGCPSSSVPTRETRSLVADGRIVLAGASFETETIELGGATQALARRVVSASQDVVVFSLSPGVEEHVQRVPAGWEQSWRFGEPIDGDLVVRVAVEGTPLGGDDAGLLFGSGSSRVHYSHGTLIDADGERLAVPARWTSGAIELRVPAAAVADARFPLVLDPTIGMAHAVVDPELLGGRVASGIVRPVWNGSSFALFANDRVVLASAGGTVMHPSQPLAGYASCTGTVYFAHHDSDGYRYVCAGGGTTHLVHLGDDLALLSSTDLGFALTNTVWVPGSSGRFLVMDAGSGSTLSARIVDASGIASAPFVFATGAGTRLGANAIWTGSVFFVAYEDDRFMDSATADLRATTIGVDGTVGSTDGIVVAGSPVLRENGPKLAPAPGGALLSYGERGSGGTCTTRTALVDSSGALLPGVGSYTLSGSCSNEATHGMFTGTGWLFHHGARGFVRFDVGGTEGRYYDVPMGPRGTPQRYAWAWGASTGLYTFIEPGTSAGVGPWFVALTDPAGDGPRVRPVVTADLMSSGHVAGSARAGVLLSVDDALRRLGPDGAPLEAARRVVGETVPVPVGDGFHAFLFGSTMLSITRLDPDGRTSVSSTPWTFGSYGSAAAGGIDGSVVVTAFAAGGLHGTRVAADGTVIDATPLRWSGAEARWPALASNGSAYLVVWESVVGTQTDIFGIRVGLDGIPIDRTPLIISSLADDEDMIHVSALGDGWLVAWAHGNGAAHRRVGSDGSLGTLHDHPLVRGPQGLDVEWGGTRALLVYREDSFDHTIFGVEISSDGTPSAAFPIVATPAAFIDNFPYPTPALASVGGDTFVLLYVAIEDWLSTTRLLARAVTLDGAAPLGAVCSSGADCRGLPCVDGVCCNAPCGGGSTADCEACSVALGALADGLCSVVAVDTICRASAGACDVEETCDGRSRACGADAFAPDGTSCADEDLCNGIESCLAGECVEGTPRACDAGQLDASRADAGSGQDSAILLLPDAPRSSDGAVTPADVGPTVDPEGCGCRGVPGGPGGTPVFVVLGLGVLLAARRPLRRRPGVPVDLGRAGAPGGHRCQAHSTQPGTVLVSPWNSLRYSMRSRSQKQSSSASRR